MDEIEFETELTFNQVRIPNLITIPVQVDYLISVSAYKVSTFDSNFRVVIDVEDKWAGNIWRGDYKH